MAQPRGRRVPGGRNVTSASAARPSGKRSAGPGGGVRHHGGGLGRFPRHGRALGSDRSSPVGEGARRGPARPRTAGAVAVPAPSSSCEGGGLAPAALGPRGWRALGCSEELLRRYGGGEREEGAEALGEGPCGRGAVPVPLLSAALILSRKKNLAPFASAEVYFRKV